MSLRESMMLAGRNLVAVLSPQRNWLPLWSVDMGPDRQARCRAFWPSHNVGRWWDAMLRLEAATGTRVPAHLEAPMIENLEACLANPLGLCGYLETREGIPDGPDPAGWFDNHSQRELLLALASFVRWRGSAWALASGRSMVEALDRWIRRDGDWDIPAMAAAFRGAGGGLSSRLEAFYDGMRGFRHVESHGRLIEALLEFHHAGGGPAALRLAERLAAWHLAVCTRPDGSAPEAEHTHTHSYLGTLRGLLMFGELTGRREYVDRVAATWDATVRRYVRRTGFVSHDLRSERDGETSSLGDVIQLALRLARHGRPELLDDAERLVRSRLLPSQITSPLGLGPAPDTDGDLGEALDERALGAFGGMHRHPHGGAQPTTDITAANLHTLCEVYGAAVEETPDGLKINFHVDFADARVRITSTREASARLAIVPSRAGGLRVRIPAWTPVESVRLTVGGRTAVASVAGGWLSVPEQPAGTEVVVAYALAEETVVERIDGVDYRVQWRGDGIAGIQPNTDWLPFYPDAV